MGYKSFEDLPVWNTAIELAVRTFAMTATGELGQYSGLKDQSELAAVSISTRLPRGSTGGPTTSCWPSFTTPWVRPERSDPCCFSSRDLPFPTPFALT